MRDWREQLRSRLAALHLSPEREASIVEELSQHLEDRRDALIAGGADAETATALTMAELERADLLTPRLGALTAAQWQAPVTPGHPQRRALGGLWHDLRYAARTLYRDPLFTAIAVLTLTLGIGLNTAMFGFMNALVLRPLPFSDPAQLVRLYRTTPEQQAGGFALSEYVALRRAEARFGRFAAFRASQRALADTARSTEWVDVSPHLFDVLGIQPVLGRSFRADDEVAASRRVVVISTAVWQNQFGGAPDVVGRVLHATDGSYQIVGVLPADATDHRLFGRVGMFSPLSLGAAARADDTARALTILGRRRADVTPPQAAALVAAVGAQAAADDPAAGGPSAWRLEPLPDSNTGPTGRALLAMLLGLSGCVLLVACSNLANLLLARAIDRVREFAIRSALGASRLQLVRTVLLESALLATVGGIGAVLVAVGATRWLQSVIVDGGGPMIPVDWRVLAFAGVVSVSTVLLCVGPALFARRVVPNDALKSGRSASAASGHVRARQVFLVAQFALALLLVAGAVFFLRGTRQLVAQSYGWTADGVVQAELSLPTERYATDEDVVAFQSRAVARLAEIPGVTAASLSYGLPYTGLRGTNHYLGDGGGSAPRVTAKINGVSPAYFDVTDTRLVAGRFFTQADTALTPKVVIVSEAMARRLFPEGRAVGRRVRSAGGEPRDWMEVVGVVANVRSIDFAQEPAPFQLYQPAAQDPRRGVVLAVRVDGSPSAATVTAVRTAIATLDEGLVTRRIRTALETLGEVTTSMSVMTRLLLAFASLGLLLAALGIYGATTRMVAQRTSEIGLRMALGAQTRDILALVMGSGTRLVVAGLALGLVGAFLLSRLLRAVLPSMSTDVGAVSAAAGGVLVVAAFVACYLPARRATLVSPLVALRTE